MDEPAGPVRPESGPASPPAQLLQRQRAMIAIGRIGEETDRLLAVPRLGRPSVAEELLDWLDSAEALPFRRALAEFLATPAAEPRLDEAVDRAVRGWWNDSMRKGGPADLYGDPRLRDLHLDELSEAIQRAARLRVSASEEERR